MVARNRVERICLSLWVLLFLLFFPAPIRRAFSEEPSGPVGPLSQRQQTTRGTGEDIGEDRWAEESERINRLEFDKVGNWRAREHDRLSDGPSAGDEPSVMETLRAEAERRQRAFWLARKNRAREIQKKWGTVRESSPTVYVEYTENNDAFGGVDYERGSLEVGAIAPVFHMDAPLRIERMLSERLSYLLQVETVPGVRDLEGQVTMPGTRRVVTPEDMEAFSRYAARSGEPPERYVAPDGVKRLRKEIRIDLMPEHLRTRVRKVLPHVQRAASVYEVAPELLLAVIQTESVFNPRAVSNAGAIGLMQLMPGSGALEASKLVYGETRLLTREELYRPDKNIELGAAYLRILLRKHFGEQCKDPEKLIFLAIASYNCGPRRVKAALGNRNLENLSAEELYDLLMRVVPRETQVYLKRVVRNMKQYESLVSGTPRWPFTLADLLKQHTSGLFLLLNARVPLSSGVSPYGRPSG